jgi:DNA-binding transcriptional regulator LsrR (DeoR family)
MPKNEPDSRAVLVAAVARECANGKTQREIGDMLGISQPEVSRRIAEAEEMGWLGRRRFTIVDQLIWQAAQERHYSTTDVRDELWRRHAKGLRQLKRITVLHTTPRGRIDSDTVDIFRVLIGDARSVGVTWGRTISSVIDALRQRATDTRWRERSAKITFVPLCGEPLVNGSNPSTVSSSVLAMRLSEIFNSTSDGAMALSIAGVPAYIPLKFTAAGEVDAFRRLFSMVRGHAQVFGTRPPRDGAAAPMVETLNAIFTSVGRAESKRRGIFLKERVQIGDTTEADMDRTVSGDIGGVIIPKSGIGPDDLARIHRMNENWMGMRLDHLRRCADEARKSGFDRKQPGVIVLAMGADRLEVVLRCVELGLVSELVIDRGLEGALRAHLGLGPRFRTAEAA